MNLIPMPMLTSSPTLVLAPTPLDSDIEREKKSEEAGTALHFTVLHYTEIYCITLYCTEVLASHLELSPFCLHRYLFPRGQYCDERDTHNNADADVDVITDTCIGTDTAGQRH
jgi:hypothetical protein